MILRWLIASLHLLALPIGAGAILLRGRGLQNARADSDLPAIFAADNLWGIAAVLWLATGIWRAFGGLEKGTGYYLAHPLFHAKLGLFILVVILEIRPMLTLLRWRRVRRRGTTPDLSRAALLARISFVQLGIILLMVFLATAVARGIGM